MFNPYPENAGSLGLYDPETISRTFGVTTFDHDLAASVTSAFPDDLLLTFMQESVINGDEWRVRSDRFGRCLSQSEIIRVYQHA